jgi:Tol biopolymer transport system component
MTRGARAILTGIVAASAVLQLSVAARADDAIDGYLAVDDFTTGQIYTLTQLGTNVTQVSHAGPDRAAIAPSWSPDGHRIAFVIVSFATGLDRMYTMAADGSDVHKIRNDGSAWNNDVPKYFPDGNRIVFARCHSDGSGCSIASVGVDGTGLQILTPVEHEVYDFFPAVSPDGSQIAFERINGNGIHAQAWIMNTDGTGAHPITPPALEALFPTWSPDGAKVTVSSNCCRLGGDVYTVPSSGGPVTRLTHTPYPNFSGFSVYSPSGREIAFVTNRNYPDRCCADLYLMSATGQHQVKVDLGLNGIATVAWGPAASRP